MLSPSRAELRAEAVTLPEVKIILSSKLYERSRISRMAFSSSVPVTPFNISRMRSAFRSAVRTKSLPPCLHLATIARALSSLSE